MTDLNSLVKPGSTPLFLVFGNDINSQGEIAFFAFDQSNGELHAAVAIPCDEKHVDTVPGETSERPKVILPENVRKLLRQRRGFGRFARASAWER